jgi:hypothetical protein
MYVFHDELTYGYKKSYSKIWDYGSTRFILLVKRGTNSAFGICVIKWVMASFTWGNISVHWTFHFSLQISIREPKIGRPRWQNAPWNYFLAGSIALKLQGDMSCGRCSTILLEAVTGNVFSFKLSLKGSQSTTMFRVDSIRKEFGTN